jgi:hypothetical protein
VLVVVIFVVGAMLEVGTTIEVFEDDGVVVGGGVDGRSDDDGEVVTGCDDVGDDGGDDDEDDGDVGVGNVDGDSDGDVDTVVFMTCSEIVVSATIAVIVLTYDEINGVVSIELLLILTFVKVTLDDEDVDMFTFNFGEIISGSEALKLLKVCE